MGLFSKKNSKDANTAATQKSVAKVNADDIWNTPVNRFKGNSVTVKESKYAEAENEKIDGVVAVNPDELRDKMAELDKEVERRDSKPAKTYHDYDINPVKQDEVNQAQDTYEKEYTVSHEKYLATHKEDINVASLEDIDNKLKAMIDEHNTKLHEMETMDFDFKSVSDDEVRNGMADLPYALKEEEMEHYKDIEGVTVSDDAVERLGRIDHSEDPDEIGEVTADQLAATMAEFEKKYANS